MTITLLDGGMGQELITRSAHPTSELWSAYVLNKEPELVEQLHYEFLCAGSDVITTNSYILHRDRLHPHGLENELKALLKQSCALAKNAIERASRGRIAGSLGPTPRSYRPDLAPPIAQAAELYAEVAQQLAPHVDWLLCETMSAVDQAHGALLGMSTTKHPIWLAVSVDDHDGSKLRSGEPITQIFSLLDQFEVDALLINCAVPEAVTQGLALIANQGIKVGCYANGFTGISQAFLKPGATVESLSRNEKLTPEVYADFAERWMTMGASIIGGCCEINTDHIKAVYNRLKSTTSQP